MLSGKNNITCQFICFALLFCSVFTYASRGDNAKYQYFKSSVADTTLPVNLRLSYYDSIIKHTDHQTKEVIYPMIEKGKLLSNDGQYLKAFHQYKEALKTIDQYLDHQNITFSVQRCEVMLQLAKMASNLGMHDESISILFDLVDYDKGQNINYTVASYSLLGVILMNLNKLESSEEYHDKALQIVNTVDTISTFNKYTTYANYAGLLYNKQKFNESIDYMLKAEPYCEQLNDHRVKANMYHNMAIIYQELGEYEIAKRYFDKSLALTSNRELFYTKCVTLQNLAYLYAVMDDPKNALRKYEEALNVAKKIGAAGVEASVMLEMSEIFYQQGDVNKAYEYMRRGQKLKDSVFNIQNMDRIMMLKSDFEMRQTTIEKDLLEKDLLLTQLNNQKKNTTLAILIIFAIILIITTIFIIRRLLKQNRTNALLNKKITDLSRQNQTKIEAAKHQFEDTIELKSRELASNALFLVQANEIITRLRDETKHLISTDNKQEMIEIANRMNLIISRYNIYGSWDEFKIYFEQIHGTFFSKLEAAHPDITKGELRLCALLALNMNAKEIASITNRSIRTVETLVYRTRKKLGIDPEVKTNVYLRRFF